VVKERQYCLLLEHTHTPKLSRCSAGACFKQPHVLSEQYVCTIFRQCSSPKELALTMRALSIDYTDNYGEVKAHVRFTFLNDTYHSM
jgi:hypothetical protein